MTSPRPYVAAAAAAALAALYFVPSASASPSQAPAKSATSHAAATAHSGDLADTGAVDTKPYVVGGAAFLVAGAGLIVNAGRRSRQSLQARPLDI
jgi:hypothetical protein